MPEFVAPKVKKICEKFQNIFHLEDEQLSINNFYKQKIHVLDDIPVYIKNYRIPHAHKEKIEKEVEIYWNREL
jgi:hypothetical protein